MEIFHIQRHIKHTTIPHLGNGMHCETQTISIIKSADDAWKKLDSIARTYDTHRISLSDPVEKRMLDVTYDFQAPGENYSFLVRFYTQKLIRVRPNYYLGQVVCIENLNGYSVSSLVKKCSEVIPCDEEEFEEFKKSFGLD